MPVLTVGEPSAGSENLIGSPFASNAGAMLLLFTATHRSPSWNRFDISDDQVKIVFFGVISLVAAKPGSMLLSPPPLILASITSAAVPMLLAGALMPSRPAYSGFLRSAHDFGTGRLAFFNSVSL